jgi:hypothetical protein
MNKLYLVFLILAIVLSACSLFENESFSGDWDFKLTGDYDGEITVTLQEDMTYSETTAVSVSGRDFDVKFSGKIQEDGKLVGLIYAQGQQMGEMSGKMNYETGEGKWNAAGIGGNWTAVKKK